MTVLVVWVEYEEFEKLAFTEVLLQSLCIRQVCLLIVDGTLLIFYRLKRHAFLVNLPAVDQLLNASDTDQSVNDHILLLPDPVAPINSLIVICRVPVWI